ncbi:hypothetical protein Tsubulata_004299 [Turnera subulata]|uniref:WW domain-containing protein n=1 Tax=Turnera subulata TaxID=218843 RepID=A0A9Q0F3I5_9ROSI|nr:hypothetical protein Tsubulata_004299 [Turnera subulata]
MRIFTLLINYILYHDQRADATTDWKEFTSPDGRKYFYNKVTKQSKWEIPAELKLARERVGKAPTMESHSDTFVNSQTPSSVPQVVDRIPSTTDSLHSAAQEAPSSPVPVIPVAAASTVQSQLNSQSLASPIVPSPVVTNADELQKIVTPEATTLGSAEVGNAVAVPKNNTTNSPGPDISSSVDKNPVQDKEGAEKDVVMGEKADHVLLEEKAIGQEPLTYADKLEAKNAFKALLESANIGSDWSWEQAMRSIINDRRYGALKTLGERKQAFTEFLNEKRKQEAEERRIKQKKAREEFRNMLEESNEMTSSARWSKALALFEDDERFKAVEREKERKDLFDAYLQELVEKERAKAQEERKRNIMEYRQFLESCDFIKSNTQWRKVQNQLEADERCSRLERIDRLEIFQDYLLDLEKEEEEQRKMQKEELRKTERKNRDEFRKLMDEHVADGSLTAKTFWRDYYMKYREDKARIKDAVKLKKMAVETQYMEAARGEVGNWGRLVFDELLERAREKEEKEAKRRKRLADDFLDLLHALKDINLSSKWDDCKGLFEASREFSSIGDESICKDIFEEYVTRLKEQAKENDRIRKEEKEKKGIGKLAVAV